VKNKAMWLAVVLAAFWMAIPFDQVLAQEKAAPAAAAPAAAAPAKGVQPAGAPGLELSKEAAAKESHASMSFIEIVTRAGWFGVLIWVMLIVASIVSVALVVDSHLTIRVAKISPTTLVEQVRSAMEQGDLLKAIQQCDKTPGPLARILKAGFANVQEGFEVIQDSVGIAADLESEKLLQRVTYLSVISNATPMLGLIGTVQGMIYAFFTLGTQQAGAAQQAMLALNISHGLWATAVGLGTAVPATIFFYFFKNKAMRIILGMEALTLDLIKSLRNVEVVEE
jgi:biopolymer transport protein ExbB